MKYLSLLIACSNLFACTGIQLNSKSHSPVNGRTVEFGTNLDLNIALIPRNKRFTSLTPMGAGMKYTSKYAAVGTFCFNLPILMDGMNEKGLSVGAFYFPGYAKYTPVTKRNRSRALSPLDFTNWILTRFATIEEVKEAVKKVVIIPTIFEDWDKKLSPPMHYIVYDKTGKSIVIEPTDQKLIVFDNELGSITNSPTFDWHLTNLNNYINLSPENVTKASIGKWKLTPFGQGTGMLGLPGDFTPPSRFVRATFFSQTAVPALSSKEAVKQAFHILNQFDIPKGVVKEMDRRKAHYDYTMLTTVKDPSALCYYYRSYENQSVEYVDLNKVDFNAREIKTMKIGNKQKITEMSSKLK